MGGCSPCICGDSANPPGLLDKWGTFAPQRRGSLLSKRHLTEDDIFAPQPRGLCDLFAKD